MSGDHDEIYINNCLLCGEYECSHEPLIVDGVAFKRLQKENKELKELNDVTDNHLYETVKNETRLEEENKKLRECVEYCLAQENNHYGMVNADAFRQRKVFSILRECLAELDKE